MVPRSEIHTAKEEAQQAVEILSTQEERNELGQFSTPPGLASQIIAVALTYLPRREPIRFLEPRGLRASLSDALELFKQLRQRGFAGIRAHAFQARNPVLEPPLGQLAIGGVE